MDTLNIFCNRCNEKKPFDVTVDGNGEWIADCRDCDHVIKFPADVNLSSAIESHNELNTRSVQVDDGGMPVLTKDQLRQIKEASKAHGP